MFDDEDGDVVLAVSGVHEHLDQQVSELMGRDMVWECSEDASDLGDADVEGAVATLDQPVGEHHELGTDGKGRDLGDAACPDGADDRCVGRVEQSDLTVGKTQDRRGMTGGREGDRLGR